MLVGTYTAKYIGRSLCGFINSHDYRIEIGKDVYGYQVSGIVDLTDDEDTTAYITYSSEKSIRRYWDIQEDIIELGGE